MITENEITKMPASQQKFARMRLEIARKVRCLMTDEVHANGGNLKQCTAVYKIHEEVASTDPFYQTREGVRKAIAAVAPELMTYATAFPEYCPKSDAEPKSDGDSDRPKSDGYSDRPKSDDADKKEGGIHE